MEQPKTLKPAKSKAMIVIVAVVVATVPSVLLQQSLFGKRYLAVTISIVVLLSLFLRRHWRTKS
jgi:uncharacterized protein YebE (UPF0316 family)